MRQAKIYNYQTFTDDFVVNKNQDYQLAADYSWSPPEKSVRVKSSIVNLFARLASFAYYHCWARPTIVNRQLLQDYPAGGFLYANHTQPQGDAFIPYHLFHRKPINFLVSAANLGIPGLGRWLPYGGVLPIPQTLHQFGCLNKEIYRRIADKQIVLIYPEAHVWPYYTKIRPLPLASFHYPISAKVASFCMTTTYQKSRWRKRPHMTIYIDGPFYPQTELTVKQQQAQLRDEIAACMTKRSQASNVDYIQYRQVEDEN
ncbi:acyl-phosphate glycerol 3-phosphate acyltransferase [Lapidilactobacillus mulanensis]|uniref:Acyl-phosphate glycerol 3-phosphate acyltransferase n=1 Tax=Lapidilactobacillus mulanensis TaxID=2485999 RepID=A0ABW4DPK5_9LACO|nr:acyl-phosphate glycerol 3-phosphate acyltransferase [Lapidilactobacillus mulanensis]